jgi:N-formylglutamate amidohydrolase
MKFDKIVLAIPHSVGKTDFLDWDRPEVAKIDSDRWTDWFTDRVFIPFYGRSRISAVVGSVSRFDCDLERLANDPLESVGRGILYNTSHSGARRLNSGEEFLHHWHEYRKDIVNELTPNSLLIDCHSFPSDVSNVDICIGINDDWSSPDEMTLDTVLQHFRDYKVEINKPFAGSLTLEAGFPYKSLMIEVNKKLYLDESGLSLTEFPFSYKVHNTICKLYEKLLDLP